MRLSVRGGAALLDCRDRRDRQKWRTTARNSMLHNMSIPHPKMGLCVGEVAPFPQSLASASCRFLLHLFAHLVASLTRSPADGSSPEESKGEPAPQTTWTGSSSRPLDGKETGGVLPVGEDTSLSPRAGVSPQNAAPVVLMQLPGPSAELLVAVRSVFLLVWELMLEDTFATFLVVGGPYLLASLRPLAVVGGLAGSDGETSKADDREKESKDDLSDEGFGALTDPSPGSFVHVQKQCDWKTVRGGEPWRGGLLARADRTA